MRILFPLLFVSALALPACRPAGDAAKVGEGMAEGGAIVEKPTGKVGDPVASGAENVVLPPSGAIQNDPPPASDGTPASAR